MKTIVLFVLIAVFFTSIAFAERVNGYYHKDGTYVSSYERSSPDGDKSNNYGPSDYSGQSPYQRDSDGDGTSNMYDYDDDNDGTLDNYDKSQYGY